MQPLQGIWPHNSDDQRVKILPEQNLFQRGRLLDSNKGLVEPVPGKNLTQRDAGHAAPTRGWLNSSPKESSSGEAGRVAPMTGWLNSSREAGHVTPTTGWLN